MRALRALVAGLSLALLGSALPGCAPQWAIVRQATPNPLSRQTQLVDELSARVHDGVTRVRIAVGTPVVPPGSSDSTFVRMT